MKVIQETFYIVLFFLLSLAKPVCILQSHHAPHPRGSGTRVASGGTPADEDSASLCSPHTAPLPRGGSRGPVPGTDPSKATLRAWT